MSARILSWRRAPVLAFAAMLAFGVSSAFANDDLLAIQSSPGQVSMPLVDYTGQNYADLDQINLENIQWLVPAWSMPLQVPTLYEAAPLVIGDTMYIVTPKPNYIYALDLTQEGGYIKWEFRPPDVDVQAATQRHCCFAVTRGLNYADNKIFFTTLDNQAYALDADTGAVVWGPVIVGDLEIAETNSGNGIVIGDLYILGNSGGERGVRGKVTALDINTGEVAWEYFNMGPNDEVGITERFAPFYADDQIENPALDSWFEDSYLRGGGTVWGWFTYDPDLNLVYYSTGNCGPWNPDYRREWGTIDLDENGGLITYRNNYCASIMARDATTGELIWAYNLTPQDAWDLDEPGPNVLVDLEIDGEIRQTLIKAARNGYFYVLDRATGELLQEPWPHSYTTHITGVDMETGRALYNIDTILFTDAEDRARYTDLAIGNEGTAVAWCPGIAARNWYPDSFSPQTGLLYTVVSSDCNTQRVVRGEYNPPGNYTLTGQAGQVGEANLGSRNADGTPADWVHQIQANDPVTGETVFTINHSPANQAAPLATAGGLLFQAGRNNGSLRAYNAATGELVWSFHTGADAAAPPISYMGPDGRQYIALVASSLNNIAAVGGMTAPNAQQRYIRTGPTLFVFALPHAIAGTAPVTAAAD